MIVNAEKGYNCASLALGVNLGKLEIYVEPNLKR